MSMSEFRGKAYNAALTLSLMLTVGAAASAMAQAQPPVLHVGRVTQPPKLEDYLGGASRNEDARVNDFRQREPGDGVPASRPTQVYLSYDDKNLYFIFVCKDDPDKVRAHLAKREDIFDDDLVVVYLDTFHDRQRAYVFAANPLGIQLDGITTEGQDDDYSFDTLWRSQGRLTGDGFIVWMSIPFKSLRFSDAERQTWGVAFGRSIPRSNEESFWPHISGRVEGFVQQMATLEGITQISPGRNIQLIPYASLTKARFLNARDESAPGFSAEGEARGGLDAKFVLRDALTLDVTVNPDFSQVESDEPQVTVNQRFEVFFPEKRPFFLENAGFFQTPINLFFSRRVADPQLGARLTGKLGRWAFGGLAIDDRAPGRLVSESNALSVKRAKVAVARVRREFGEQSNVGLLMTSREFGPSSNRVISADARMKLTPNWIFTGQFMGSRTRQIDGRRLSGQAYFAELEHESRNFDYAARYVDFSPGFRSQLGFVRRVDVRQVEQEVGYSWRPKDRRVVRFGPSLRALANWDRRSRLQDWRVNAEFEVELTGSTELEVGRSEAFELFEGRGFRRGSTGVDFRTEWLKWLELSLSFGRGTNINFDPAPGLAPFLADEVEGEFEMTLRPTPRLRFNQLYIYNRLRARKGVTTAGGFGRASIFNNHIARWALNYQFTRELSLRAIIDYEAVLANASLVDLEREKRLGGDVLLTYLVNPGTAIYIGYTDTYENLAIDSALPRSLRRTVAPGLSTGRQFFIKASYLLRY